MKKSIASILGFTLVIVGFLSLLLMGFGLRLSYLTFIDNMGDLAGFIIRLCMIIFGLIILYVSRTNTPRASQTSD